MDDYKSLLDKRQLTMWLDISTYCNAGCPQCHRTNPNGLDKIYWLPLVQWSIDDFKKAFPISSMARIDKFDICGTWGDPLMNKDIYEIVEYIIENSECAVQLHTNGSMRDNDFWWNIGVLCGKRLNVQFTVDGVTEQEHSFYRQKTSLAKTLSHMLTLTSTNATAGVYTVIFEHNERSIQDIAKLSREHGAHYITFVPSNRFRVNDEEFNSFKFTDDQGVEQTFVKSNLKKYITGALTDKFIESLAHVL